MHTGCQEWLMALNYRHGWDLVRMRDRARGPAGRQSRSANLTTPFPVPVASNGRRVRHRRTLPTVRRRFAAPQIAPLDPSGEPLGSVIVWHNHMQSKVQDFSSKFSGKLMLIILSLLLPAHH